MPDGTPMIDNAALPRLLDVPGLAAHLGVKERHIRRLIAERRIPFTSGATSSASTLTTSPPGSIKTVK